MIGERPSDASALSRLLAHEGGYNNHPSDPGGPTNFGITIHDYRQYVKRNAMAADVKTMALDEAKRIYRAKYWDAQRCSDLPAGVDPCGERGEFHTFCTAGPMFTAEIAVEVGERVTQDGFCFADLLPTG